ncbi:MAG: hypothetical protein K6G15_00510 [Desulfovibrio sp.]|nr:hypothetical protein [Desulfovibrio sp.]
MERKRAGTVFASSGLLYLPEHNQGLEERGFLSEDTDETNKRGSHAGDDGCVHTHEDGKSRSAGSKDMGNCENTPPRAWGRL